MKKTVLTILLIFGISSSSVAKCSNSGLWVFPKSSEIHLNDIIVVEGYASSQRIIDSLNNGYPIYLEADGHKVEFEILEVHKGMFQLTQAILRPLSELKFGKKYVLKIKNLKENEAKALLLEMEKFEKAGGKIVVVGAKLRSQEILKNGGFLDEVGGDNFFDKKSDALNYMYSFLDKRICKDCKVLAFEECTSFAD